MRLKFDLSFDATPEPDPVIIPTQGGTVSPKSQPSRKISTPKNLKPTEIPSQPPSIFNLASALFNSFTTQAAEVFARPNNSSPKLKTRSDQSTQQEITVSPQLQRQQEQNSPRTSTNQPSPQKQHLSRPQDFILCPKDNEAPFQLFPTICRSNSDCKKLGEKQICCKIFGNKRCVEGKIAEPEEPPHDRK